MALKGLMDLPSEVRLMVFEQVFAKSIVHETHDRRGIVIMKKDCNIALARTNKTIHDECMPIFYRNVKLVISSTDLHNITKTRIPGEAQAQIKTAYCSERVIKRLIHKQANPFFRITKMVVTKYLQDGPRIRLVTNVERVRGMTLDHRVMASIFPPPAPSGIKRKRDGTLVFPDGTLQSRYTFRMQQWREWGVYPVGVGPRHWCDKRLVEMKDLDDTLKILKKRAKKRGRSVHLDAVMEEVREDRKALEKRLFIDEVYDVDN